jgi:predicted nucleic acid-binding protein
MPDVACIDTQILIWGLKEEASTGQESWIPIAKEFLKKLSEEKTLIVIPSIVLAELLISIPKNERESFISEIEKSFIIAPFDVVASNYYTEVWESNFKQIKDNHSCTRDHLKADLMIYATALATSSKVLYTHDSEILAIKHNSMECQHIPDIQLPLI